jgi:CubicO group peptidase (beta-lactamase class C family)
MDGSGDINSNIEDMAKWVSLQLAGGTTPGGQRIASAENLAYTHTPKVAMSDKALRSYRPPMFLPCGEQRGRDGGAGGRAARPAPRQHRHDTRHATQSTKSHNRAGAVGLKFFNSWQIAAQMSSRLGDQHHCAQHS